MFFYVVNFFFITLKSKAVKKLFLILIFIASFPFLNAQITINSVANLVSAGDTIIQSHDDNITSFSPGGTGEQTWDFSNLTTNGDNDSLIFIDMYQTPFYNLFPDANFAVMILDDNNGNTDTMFQYIETSDMYLHILGIYVSQYKDVHSFPYQNMMPFPVTYNDEFFSDYYSVAKFLNGNDSMMYKLYVNDTVNVDAYGTVNIPLGNFQCLRFCHNSFHTDSVFIKTAGTWNFQTVSSYNQNYYEWWTNDPAVKMKILELKVNESGDVIDGDFVSRALIHGSSVSEFNNSDFNILYLENGDIYLKNIPKGFNNVAVYDLSGKQILNHSIYTDCYKLNVQNIPKGVYILSIYSSYAKTGKKIIIK